MATIQITRSDIDNARAITRVLEMNEGEIELTDDEAIALQDALDAIGIAAGDLEYALNG